MTRKRTSSFSSVEDVQLSELTNIPGHLVQYNESHRLLLIDGMRIDCTPIEYSLLLCLLEQCGRPVPFVCLVQRGLHSSLDRSSRHSLTQHIVRLRHKLQPFDMSILAVTSLGYQLFVEPVDTTDNQQEAAPILVGNAPG
jgi:DNA-binding response OmpR family regulator